MRHAELRAFADRHPQYTTRPLTEFNRKPDDLANRSDAASSGTLADVTSASRIATSNDLHGCTKAAICLAQSQQSTIGIKMSNEIRLPIEGFSKTKCQALFAGINEGAYVQNILHQLLPGTETSVEKALNSICEYVHPGTSESSALIGGLINALGKIGLRVARAVPGFILGQDEARLYVQPRLLIAAYPELKEHSPRPYAYTVTLSGDELCALDGLASGFGFKEDWPENNEYEVEEVEESKEEEVIERFKRVLMELMLPDSQITVAQAVEELCAALIRTDESSLERCDALHMELERMGVRFHKYSDRFDHRFLSGKGFLRLENSRQFVRLNPELDSIIPPVHLSWIAMLPKREHPWTQGQSSK
ncbi:hypothetical protein [Variovorax sp. J31P207]|uniref:hypothetical protein n=1 Tax=Variovorax sp. J31P207 TaxID=3053510 RepID=UPI002576586F|nr:hypothetical protein [Variovorax sp. J31P207]MDM0068395.1 hypothetical protein [Variovorax sp. J31P207]